MKYSLMAFMVLLAGCSGTKETSATRPSPGTGVSEAERVERTFAPADHDPESRSSLNPADRNHLTAAGSLDTSGGAAPEMIQGYRVQLLATTDIDEVSTRKTMLEDAFPTEWFYVEFDPPVYKLRAGNFPSRLEADRFARLLTTKGITDAWAVPERVFKYPPPVPPKPAQPSPAVDSTGSKQQ